MSDDFDSLEFVSKIEEKLVAIAEIYKMVLKKQMTDLSINPETMTPEQAELVINNVTEKLEAFIGEDGAKFMKTNMRKDLRKSAPKYFKDRYGV